MNDEIVSEVRRARDEFAARFNYDLRAMGEYLKAQQNKAKKSVIARPTKKIVPLKKHRKVTRKAA